MNLDSWDEIGLHTGAADRPAFERAARACYEHAQIPWHGNVVWVTSPLVVALGAPVAALAIAARRCGHGEQHDPELQSLVDMLTHDTVGGALWDAVCEAVSYARRERPPMAAALMERVTEQAVEGALAGSLRSSAGVVGDAVNLGSALRAMRLAVHAGVRAALGRLPKEGGTPLRQALREVIARAWYQYISGQRRIAFGLLFDDLCGEGELRAWERAYQDATAAACCWYPHREFLFVCEWPEEIHIERIEPRDRGDAELHLLHRTDGAALSWSDGWGVHAMHGRHRTDRTLESTLPEPG